ncbi:helix-turn-helix transcriptional regulator [Allokutzneria sp. A3M-2-11 16]|uniref:helix-turn-helix domain-containing protein n=1 Tax=Allokutzneria sp. A3M-2-11 16 TaxID=2962043 RepID=UPI0020B7FD30|nr:helix-turn-helix transcriptional regulator [Allokutzneria sp. A3M-2-11 16]MCP3800225.1 helix-turn-helix transcriptional regulator [Allokutzneria sp. A3M-2-11 16]
MDPAQAKDELARRLRGQLAAARQATGTTQADLARVLGCEPAKVSRVLSGSRGITADEVLKLLDFFGVAGDVRREIEELSRAAARRRPKVAPGAQPEKFSRLLRREQTARAFRSYSTELVPGMLQLPELALRVIRLNPLIRPEDREALRDTRVARLHRLLAAGKELHFILSEAVIRCLAGESDLMGPQLRHMIELSEHDQITIQVMPFSAGIHAASGFGFVLLEQRDPADNFVFLESLAEVTWVEEAHLVKVYAEVLEDVGMRALAPPATRDWLTNVVSEL